MPRAVVRATIGPLGTPLSMQDLAAVHRLADLPTRRRALR